ncbi:MAG TPA: hypothetical protein P5555_08815 [Candidatus Paceibacterota bacterium]|nr:hypothetical protein [Verrucomicrobiota bacterium]HRZ45275.1 hypothetical protein [Candidatus Paceibacterota bacterium]HRZ99284.1 hypothetical protein [Candidatus Paceibacterota bacterium]
MPNQREFMAAAARSAAAPHFSNHRSAATDCPRYRQRDPVGLPMGGLAAKLARGSLLLAATLSAAVVFADTQQWWLPAEQDIYDLRANLIGGQTVISVAAGSHVYLNGLEDGQWLPLAKIAPPIPADLFMPEGSDRFVAWNHTNGISTDNTLRFFSLAKEGTNFVWRQDATAPLPRSDYWWLLASKAHVAVLSSGSPATCWLVKEDQEACALDTDGRPLDKVRFHEAGFTAVWRSSPSGPVTFNAATWTMDGTKSNTMQRESQEAEDAVFLGDHSVFIWMKQTASIEQFAVPGFEKVGVVSVPGCTAVSQVLETSDKADGLVVVGYRQENRTLWRLGQDGAERYCVPLSSGLDLVADSRLQTAISPCMASGHYDDSARLIDLANGATLVYRLFSDGGPATQQIMVDGGPAGAFAVKGCFWRDGLEIVRVSPDGPAPQMPYELSVYPLQHVAIFAAAEIGKPMTLPITITNSLIEYRRAEVLISHVGDGACFAVPNQVVTVPAEGASLAEITFTAPVEGQYWAEAHILNQSGHFVPILLLAHTRNAAELKPASLTIRAASPGLVELEWLEPFSAFPFMLEYANTIGEAWRSANHPISLAGTTRRKAAVDTDDAAMFFRLRSGP